MAHPNEKLLRDAYAAFGRGDLDGYWVACREDFTFNVPGRSRVGAAHQGEPAQNRASGHQPDDHHRGDALSARSLG